MSIREDAFRELSTGIAKGGDDIIRGGLPQAFHVDDITCHVHPNGVRVYLYRGRAFLELHPVEIIQTGDLLEGIKFKATQRYRYLSQIEEDRRSDEVETE